MTENAQNLNNKCQSLGTRRHATLDWGFGLLNLPFRDEPKLQCKAVDARKPKTKPFSKCVTSYINIIYSLL